MQLLVLLISALAFAAPASVGPVLALVGQGPGPADVDAWTGEPVRLCFVDTGARADHEALAPRWSHGYDFLNNDSVPEDENGHGTHLAGVAAAVLDDRGVPDAGVVLLAAKAMGADGEGAWAVVAEALQWCVRADADVVVLALAAQSPSRVVEEAVQDARAQGVLVVASAGNNGPCDDCVAYPAAYDGVVAVGALAESGERLSSSATGPQVDLWMPGEQVRGPDFTGAAAYNHRQGTSVAAAHAGALLAAALWADPDLDSDAALAFVAQA